MEIFGVFTVFNCCLLKKKKKKILKTGLPRKFAVASCFQRQNPESTSSLVARRTPSKEHVQGETTTTRRIEKEGGKNESKTSKRQ